MEPIIEQIKATFPDIQEADIHRIMDFLGYSTDDILSPDPQYRLINGESIFIQSCILQDDIERSQQLKQNNNNMYTTEQFKLIDDRMNLIVTISNKYKVPTDIVAQIVKDELDSE